MTLTDPQTLDPVDLAQVDDLVKTLRAPRSDQHRRIVLRQLTHLGVAIQRVSNDLVSKLDRGWERLEGNEDDTRFGKWAGWLRRYEACQDALRTIERHVLTDREVA